MFSKIKNFPLRVIAALTGFLVSFGIILALESMIKQPSFVVHGICLSVGILIGGFVHELVLKRFMSKAISND